MAETIEITIEPNGDVKVEGIDISGPDCEQLTRGIEQALGSVESKRRKPEYSRPREVRRKV